MQTGVDNEKIAGNRRFSDFPSRGSLLLAIAATGTTVCISVLAGWQRGDWLAERLLWCAISIVLVLCVHLLPALCRAAPPPVRCIAAGVWAVCAIAVSFSHVTFFLMSQLHAGERRAEAITLAAEHFPKIYPSGRTLTAISAEQATVRAAIGDIEAHRCARNCASVRANGVALTAKLDALNVEADETKRRERAEDRRIEQASHVTTLRDSARDDPVTARLAGCLGMTEGKVNLLLAFVFAAELEGVACLCWYLALRPGSTARIPVDEAADFSVTPVVTAGQSESHTLLANCHVTRDRSAVTASLVAHDREDRRDETSLQLTRDIAAGHLRATVADIRRHLGCSQARAAELRRQIGSL
ncbi:hypothetical protein [Paraburkholderia saeva]|uniref:Uncharacterized protein n=1 Tax=Paraburkholderia saeva TaxID=2777537 RepID=A0A9N8RSY4_9BURK|nr:hypothetical protein [Paraburkholderia saeva]CAG4886714.1 hypothetical protein R70241_00244 [Paraburkholderia saeva]CAG4887231.1 hypothetical protein LMG31841_00374 [Paraburkholderia saeva]